MRAADLARDMLIDLAGPRDWHATKQSLIARAALRAQLSFRRAKSIIYNEQRLRLSADEYLAIEHAWKGAHESVAQVSVLARDADVRASEADALLGRAPDGEGRPADRAERAPADAAVRRTGR